MQTCNRTLLLLNRRSGKVLKIQRYFRNIRFIRVRHKDRPTSHDEPLSRSTQYSDQGKHKHSNSPESSLPLTANTFTIIQSAQPCALMLRIYASQTSRFTPLRTHSGIRLSFCSHARSREVGAPSPRGARTGTMAALIAPVQHTHSRTQSSRATASPVPSEPARLHVLPKKS